MQSKSNSHPTYKYLLDGKTYGLGHIRTQLEHRQIKPGTQLIRSDGAIIVIVEDPAGALRMVKQAQL